MKTEFPEVPAPAARQPDIAVLWQPRSLPLDPAAVGATGAAALALARRLLALDDASLSRLNGVGSDRLLLVLGERDALPWVDGAFYLGRDPAAPGVLVSTTQQASVPLPLLLRALRLRFPDAPLPFAILPHAENRPLVVPLGAARPVTREALTRWRERNG